MFDTLAFRFAALYRDFAACTSQKLEQMGLHFGLLFFLLYVGKHPGSSPTELTEALGLDWGHSQRCLTKLADGGFIAREKAGRRYRLDLTDKGREAFEASHRVFFEWDEQHMATLTPEERETLLCLLDKLVCGRGRPGSGRPQNCKGGSTK